VGYFLITTADERTWSTHQGRVLFLGEWCRRYSGRGRSFCVDYEVQPYHWDDRARLERDYAYLGYVYERRLAGLGETLNALHGCRHTARYWRIVLGPWLRYFVEILYDRFLSIMAAAARPIHDTWILRSDAADWIPADMLTFYHWIKTDQWNHRMYAELIQLTGGIPHSIVEERITPEYGNGSTRGRRSSRVSDVGLLASRLMPQRWTRLVFVSPLFAVRDIVRLQMALGLAPASFTARCMPFWHGRSHEGRAQFAAGDARDEFEAVLLKCLPSQVPAGHVELYEQLQQEARRKFVRRPAGIYTATAFSANEGFKVWAAESVEAGAKLLIAQHGGHYGLGRFNQGEDHEIAISDRYYTWGWQSPALGDRIKALPPGKLVGPKVRRLRPRADGPILLILISFPRYSNRLYSAPLGPQGQRYISDQLAFLNSLTADVQKQVRIRLDPNPAADGWETERRLVDAGFGGRIEPRCLLYSRLRECRCCVCTHNGTVFLETLCANYPTVVYWNPAHWELRSEVGPYFDDLRRAGIFHATPEQAAAQIVAHHRDVASWWRSPVVQSARARFCDRFANPTRDWIGSWRREVATL
jgi:putative transferase (TIGR04331 family)